MISQFPLLKEEDIELFKMKFKEQQNGTQVGLIITNGQTSIILIFPSGDRMYIDTHSHRQGREFGALRYRFQQMIWMILQRNSLNSI